jgi:hypothetical protein
LKKDIKTRTHTARQDLLELLELRDRFTVASGEHLDDRCYFPRLFCRGAQLEINLRALLPNQNHTDQKEGKEKKAKGRHALM